MFSPPKKKKNDRRQTFFFTAKQIDTSDTAGKIIEKKTKYDAL